jgi:hypothetical protein
MINGQKIAAPIRLYKTSKTVPRSPTHSLILLFRIPALRGQTQPAVAICVVLDDGFEQPCCQEKSKHRPSRAEVAYKNFSRLLFL